MEKKSDLLLILLIFVLIGGIIFIKPRITGFAVVEGNVARLIIYDTTDNTTIYPNKEVIFYANFTNITSNVSILGYCNITFEDSADNAMTYSSGLYIYNRTFSSNGTFEYNITCTDESYETLTAVDNVFITARENVCIGANYNFSCKEIVNESCTLNGTMIVNGTCFTIGADDVTIDCDGNTLLGINNSSIGIYIQQMINNSIIKNCLFKNNLTDPKTQTFFGIIGDNAPGNVTIFNNTFYNNTAGIYLDSLRIGADIYNNNFSEGESSMVIFGQYGLGYQGINIHNNYAEKFNYRSGYPAHNGIASFRRINNSLKVYENFFSSNWDPVNVEFYRVDNAEIFNNYFLGGTNHPNLWFAFSERNHFYNNTVHNGTDGIAISGCNYNLFERNYFLTNIHHPFAVFTYGGKDSINNIIFNNTMESPGYYGVIISTMYNDGRFVTGTNISNNYFNNTKTAVYTGYIGYPDSGTIIENNIINNTKEFAIIFPSSVTSNNLVVNNLITNTYYDGIYSQGSYGNNYINNTIIGSANGIYVENSFDSNIINNTIINNRGYGLYTKSLINSYVGGNTLDSNNEGLNMEYCSNLILENNSISNSIIYNFGLLSNDYSGFNYSIDTSNTINGKPIYYILDQNDVDYGEVNGSVLYMVNSTNITISNFMPEKNKHGVFLWRTENSTISSVNSFGNNINLEFQYSQRNKIIDSDLSNATGYSIYSTSGNSNITLINSSYYNISLSDSILYFGWHLDVYVHNSTGPFENATVNGYNAGSLIFNETTNSSGRIQRKEIFQYYATSTGNILYSFPDYILNVSYGNMKNSTSISPTQNREVSILLKNVTPYNLGGKGGGTGSKSIGGAAPVIIRPTENKTEETKQEPRKEQKEEIIKKETNATKEEIKPIEEMPQPVEKEGKKSNILNYIIFTLFCGLLALLVIFARKKHKIEDSKKLEQPKETEFNILKEQIKKSGEENLKVDKFKFDVNNLQKKIDEINNQLKRI